MPTISFIKKIPEIFVPKGANLMKALLENGLPVASSCYGQGICSKCRVHVIHGAENLSKPNALETQMTAKQPLPDGHRLSCQTKVLGDITIDTTYW